MIPAMPMSPRPSPIRQAGLSLIELLVAMAIGLVVILAVANVVVFGESHKRSATTTNDMNQTGAYASYLMDRLLRSAGSGFVQDGARGVLGCRLNAARVIGGAMTAVLPRQSAFPAPFAGFLGGAVGAGGVNDLRVAPILIDRQAGSDTLVVMGGNAAAGDVARPIRTPGNIAAGRLRLDNTLGLAPGDVGLVAEEGVVDCLFQQVDVRIAGETVFPVGNVEMPLCDTACGGYGTAAANVGTLNALRESGDARFVSLGSVGARNTQLMLIGAGNGAAGPDTLYAYDLLRQAGGATAAESDTNAMTALADGVIELRAIYGIDTNADGRFDAWTAPTGNFAIAALMVNPDRIRQIVSVRVAMVLRASQLERDDVSDGLPELFSGTGQEIAARVFAAGTDRRRYRWRVIEATVPLRNQLLASPAIPATP